MSFLSQPITLFPVSPRRQIGAINVDVIISENTNDALTITKQPVQQGASITDHAYKEPTSISMSIQFAQDLSISLDKIYQNLLDLQNSRVPFDIVTPKRIYRNMLLAVLSNTTDKNTENVLAINATFQEVILVNVTAVQVPRSQQKNPGSTGATETAGRKSALLIAKEGIGKLFGQ